MEVKVAKCTIDYTYLAGGGSATAYTHHAFHLRGNVYVLDVLAKVKTAFVTAVLPEVSVGVSGDTDKYIKKQHITKVGSLVSGTHIGGRDGYCTKMDRDMKSDGSSEVSILATFSATSGLTSTSAGELEIIVVYVE